MTTNNNENGQAKEVSDQDASAQAQVAQAAKEIASTATPSHSKPTFNILNDAESCDYEVWSIDDGYGDLKANNGKKEQGGVVGENEQLNTWEFFKRTGKLLMPSHVMLDNDKRSGGLVNENIDPLSHIKVTYEGRRYIVGLAAVEQDPNAKWIGQDNKHSHMLFPVLLATTLGLLAKTEKTVVDMLVMSLPVNAEKDQARHDKLRERVIDKKFHETIIELADGTVLKRSVAVKELDIQSQPFGTFCSELYNEDGSYRNMNLVDEVTTIADIGTKTFNILTYGKMFNVLESLTHNTNDGMMEAYKRINDDVLRATNTEVQDGKLAAVIKSGFVDKFDLTDFRNFHYEYQAQIVNTELNTTLDNSYALIQNVMWTGGGAEALQDYLRDKMDSRLAAKKVYFKNRFSTAEGLRNFGVMLYKASQKSS